MDSQQEYHVLLTERGSGKMEIYAVKLNGMVNPMGCVYDELVCSWKVRGAKGKKQRFARVEVGRDVNFKDVEFCAEGEEPDSVGQVLKVALQPYTRYYYRVSVTSDAGETAVSETCWFETAKREEPWTAKWIGLAEGDTVHPEFRRDFSCKKPVRSARLYICGLGLFEAYVNGEKAGNDFLAPFLNDYYAHVQYCTYDVTASLRAENEITVLLGNGWFKGRFGCSGLSGFFGKKFALIAELRIVYADGTVETVCTDDRWKYRGSIFEVTDVYDGEHQNYLLWEDTPNPWRQAVEMEAPCRLTERYSLPVHPMEKLPVKELIHTAAGETVLDFGQNFAGYVECSQPLPRGTVLKIGRAHV